MKRWIALSLFAAAAVLPPAREARAAEVSRSQEIRARVFKLLNEGIQAVKEGKPKEAIPKLESASRIALNSFRAYYYLGAAYKADRQYQKAIEPLEIALELDPVNLQARVLLAECYLQRGDPAEALAEYHRALELQSDYAPAHDGLGRVAEAAGDEEKAIEHYRKAIALNPGFPDAALNLGDLLMREGRHNEAIELFVQAIKVRPDFAAAYNRLGVAYARQRMGNEAIAALRKAGELEQGNAWHAVTIGSTFEEMGHLVQAMREYDRALAMDADYLEGYLGKARLLRRQGRFPEAGELLAAGKARPAEDARTRARMQELEKALEAESARLAELDGRLAAGPRTMPDLLARADLKAAIGDHAAALADLREAASLPEAATQDPDARKALLGRLAYCALQAGQFEEASTACVALTSLLPGDADVLINLGLARSALGDVPGAEAALKEAVRLRPGDHRPHAYLGNLYALSGQRDHAIESLGASLALMPEGMEERQRVERLLQVLRERPAGGS
ncbi:MAG TPA: tetratricopeptide repeat protein [Candidatus Polarisedimenticolia bacterium]|nr:tetratricopeptide repeat protein [Candidatus Polarisedimenticolia bacterium]